MLVIVRETCFAIVDEDSLFVQVAIFNEDFEPDLKVIGDSVEVVAFNNNGVVVVAEVALLPCEVGAMKLPVLLEDDGRKS